MSGNVEWHGDEFKRDVHTEAGRIIKRACIVVSRRAKVLLSVSGTGVKKGGTVVRKVKGMKGKTIYGAFPSRPGEPPRKQTGRLRSSVTYEVDESKLIGRVGTNLPYGRELELGRSNMKPRPWLRRAMAESQADIAKFVKILAFRNE